MSYRRYYTPRRETRERPQPSRNNDPTWQLERGRQENDQKLKGRFEHIFAKYAKDFSSVGDEIDMETGEIVVDNGHITCMQHERDVGSNPSSQFVAAFAGELEDDDNLDDNGDHDGDHGMESGSEDDLGLEEDDGQQDDEEDDAQDDEEDGEDGADGRDGEEDELSLGHAEHATPSKKQRKSPGQYSSSQTARGDHNRDDLESNSPGYSDRVHETYELGHTHSQGPDDMRRSPSPEAGDSSVMQSTELAATIPPISIETSINALVRHQDSSGRIDPAAIQDLGLSIANQIADFLMKATAARLNPQPYVSRNIWSVPPLPSDASRHSNSRLRNYDLTPAPDRYPSVIDSPGASSLWAPNPDMRQSRPNKRRKKHHQPDSIRLRGEHQPHRSHSHLQPHHHHYRHHSLPLSDDGSSSVSAADTRDPGDASDQTETPEPDGRGPLPFPRGLVTLPQSYHTHLDARPKFGTKFTPEEDRILVYLRDEGGLAWPQMIPYFAGRTPNGLQSRYTRLLRKSRDEVVVKREVIEVTDGDDEVLRLDHRDNTPITVSSEDDDFHRDNESTRFYPVDMTPLQPTSVWPALGPAHLHPGNAHYAFHFPNSYPQPNAMHHPQMAYPSDYGGAKARLGPRKRHNKPESHSRYAQFDSTLPGSGTFGVLRTDQPVPMASIPQEKALGPRTGTTGAFGVLRMNKPSELGKLAKAIRKPNYPSGSTAKMARQNPLSDQALPSSRPYTSIERLKIMPPSSPRSDQARSPVTTTRSLATEANNEANIHVIRDVTPNAPAYPDAEQSDANSGPYYLSEHARQHPDGSPSSAPIIRQLPAAVANMDASAHVSSRNANTLAQTEEHHVSSGMSVVRESNAPAADEMSEDELA